METLTCSILELIGLDAQEVISSVRLEQPDPKLGEAGSSKTPIRLSPFWSWKKVHFAKGSQGVSDDLKTSCKPTHLCRRARSSSLKEFRGHVRCPARMERSLGLSCFPQIQVESGTFQLASNFPEQVR